MARKKKEKVYLLEINEIITVKSYHRGKFENQEEKVYQCSNCNAKNKYKQVYELENGNLIDLCFPCTKKIHNLTTNNPKFRKY